MGSVIREDRSEDAIAFYHRIAVTLADAKVVLGDDYPCFVQTVVARAMATLPATFSSCLLEPSS